MATSSGACEAPADEDHYRIGLSFLQREMYDLAAAELETFLQAEPKSPNAPTARYALANCLRRGKQLNRAIAELDAALASGVFDFEADARLLRAQCLFDAERFADSAEACTRFLDRHPEHAQADRARLLGGESLYRAGKFDAAAGTLEAVARNAQSSDRPRAMLLVALSHFSRQDYAKSVEAASTLRSIESPYKARASLIEGQCRSRRGENTLAIDRFREASSTDDEAVKLDAVLGWSASLRDMGKNDDALRVLDHHVGTAKTPAHIGRASLERARVQAALEDYAAALKSLEGVPDTLDSRLWIDVQRMAARCESRQGRHKVAASRLQQLLKTSGPTPDPEVIFDLGLSLAQGQEYQEAADHFEKILENNKGDSLVADSLAALAQCQLQLGQPKVALSTSDRYLSSHSNHAMAATVRFVRAQCLEQIDEHASASKAYAEFVTRHASDPRADAARLREGIATLRAGDADAGITSIASGLKAGSIPKEDRIAGLSALANAAIASADWTTASKRLQELRELLTEESQSRDISYRIGLCFAHLGEHANAAREFALAATGDPTSTMCRQATLELGKSLLAADRAEDARARLERLLDESNTSDSVARQARSILSEIATRQGRTEEALLLIRAIKGPDSATLGDTKNDLREATLLLASSRYEEAEQLLRSLTKRADAPAEVVAEATARHAICLSRLERHDDALEAVQAALGLQALNSELARALRYERGRLCVLLHRAEEAVEDFSAIAKGPPSTLGALAYLELARIELATSPPTIDHTQAALAYIEKSKAHQSNSPSDASEIIEQQEFLRGMCQSRLGAEESTQTLSAFVDQFPHSTLLGPTHFLLGQELGKRKKWAEATTHLKAAVALAKDKDTRQRAMLLLGNARLETQHWNAAESTFTEFLEQHPDGELWFQARFGQGWARENAGNYESAIEAYLAVVRGHKGQTAARSQFQIGECRYALKQYDAALREYAKVDALYAYPEWGAAALFESARCLRDLGREDDARRGFSDVLRRFSDTNWAKLAREQLASYARKSPPSNSSPTGLQSGSDSAPTPSHVDR